MRRKKPLVIPQPHPSGQDSHGRQDTLSRGQEPFGEPGQRTALPSQYSPHNTGTGPAHRERPRSLSPSVRCHCNRHMEK